MWTLYEGDCLEIMRQLSSESVDAVITDPPYGTTEEDKSKLNGITSAGWKDFGELWDKELPLEWIGQAARLLKPGGSFIAWTDTKRTETLWKACEANGLRPLQCVYWHKTNPAPNPRKNFASAVETAVFARKPGKVLHWGGGGFTHNLYESPKIDAEHKQHPTQKPVGLMAWCIRLVTTPGSVVLDPYAGSGTTLAAAEAEGRNSIGIEINPDYCAIIRERMSKVQQPLIAIV